MSALQVFQDYYESLIDLPMNDAKFIAKLYTKRLLPGNLKSTIQAHQTSADKAMMLLDKVIEPSVKNNDLTSFKTLLLIMEDGDNDILKKLANDIRSSLDHLPSSCSSDHGELFIFNSITTSSF